MQRGFNDEHDCFDFRKEAPWRRNIVTVSEVIAETTQHRYPSGIWSIPGLTIKMFKPDWMHCCGLGILQYVMGNVMWELLKHLGGRGGIGEAEGSLRQAPGDDEGYGSGARC